jgi:hypothetical protein
MFSGTNGGKGEREQYFERVTVVSLIMCSRWDGWSNVRRIGWVRGNNSATVER